MKEIFKKIVLTLVMICFCGSVMGVQSVSADDSSYTTTGGCFAQGIDDITCVNNVVVDDYPIAYAAIEAAIYDWDWHLELLNEQKGVDWNIRSVSDQFANSMIEIMAKTDEEIVEYMHSVGVVADLIDESVLAYVLLFNGGENVSVNRVYTEAKIILCVDQLQEQGYLQDYNAIKSIVNHEIGHTLGLGEYIGDYGVIMFPVHEMRTAYVPTAADLNGVYAIYG